MIDALYRMAQVMSTSPSQNVTFQAFATVPPIMALYGEREQDLSIGQLAYCWRAGSLGASFFDRLGFERVWKLVQGMSAEYIEFCCYGCIILQDS